jgi:hypothetical protein
MARKKLRTKGGWILKTGLIAFVKFRYIPEFSFFAGEKER